MSRRVRSMVRTFLNRLRYAVWRCRCWLRPHSAGLFADRDRTYYVDPQSIVRCLDRRDGQNPASPAFRRYPSSLLTRGRIVGGDWDTKSMPFEETDVWLAFEHRFLKGGSWEETAFFLRAVGTIEAGYPRWGCASREAFQDRMRKVDVLCQSIKLRGYKSQPELGTEARSADALDDEVHVHIDRNGHYLFAEGRHRFCIARVLGLRSIPVKVSWRHAHWAALRRDMLQVVRRHGKAYAPVLHPDLADIPALHSHARMALIESVLPGEGLALDIGANWGYFAQQLAMKGLRCIAAEVDKRNCSIMRRLIASLRLDVEVVEGDVLTMQWHCKFDVVLALNIFHHFIKRQSSHDQLIMFLERLDASLMVFEPHRPSERQMKGAYRNYQPEEFVEFVMRHGRFRSKRLLGCEESGRPVFALTR